MYWECDSITRCDRHRIRKFIHIHPPHICCTMASNAASQPVTFFTRTTYQLPSQKFMIPTSWKRYQLSQLINKALDLSKPVPFDFLIRGSILRNALSSWCTENGVGEVCRLCVYSFFKSATDLFAARKTLSKLST